MVEALYTIAQGINPQLVQEKKSLYRSAQVPGT